MYWLSKQIWKNSIIATLLCFMGCSIGTMVINYYLNQIGLNRILILIISFIVGVVSCYLFIVGWSIFLRKMTLKESLKKSLKMSFISVAIMVATENLIMLLFDFQHTVHAFGKNYLHYLWPMLLAMGGGFLLALPYNYYVLSKTGKACHE